MRRAKHVLSQMCSQGRAEENKRDREKWSRKDEGKKDRKNGLLDIESDLA